MSVSESTVTAYLEALLWSETLSVCDEDGNPGTLVIPDDAPCQVYAGDEIEDGAPLDSFLDVCDLPALCPDVVAEAREDLEGFQAYCEETLGFDPFDAFDASQVAHDFCLSRNGHGAGFFDGDYCIRREDLSEAALVLVDVALTRKAGRGLVDSDVGEEHVNYSDALQDAASTFGTMGLDVWVNEAGKLCAESHG